MRQIAAIAAKQYLAQVDQAVMVFFIATNPNAHMCDQVVAVNAAAAETLRGLGLPRVAVLGHTRTEQPTPRPFAERQGMLFLSAIHQTDSPNHDGLC
jgi:hypothetical protein